MAEAAREMTRDNPVRTIIILVVTAGLFERQAAFVTGAGCGIGFALCRHFAREGARVAVNDSSAERAEGAARAIAEEISQPRVTAHPADVADVPALRASIAAFAESCGRLDVVVANAGITHYGAFLDYDQKTFDRLTSVNLRGTYFTAQAAARTMIARRTPGRILLMSSVTGLRAIQNLSAYSMTKAGIRMMARSLALELAEYGITVNAISPGAVSTERTREDDPNFDANWATVTPTGRTGGVEDVVSAASFLTSSQSTHITGQTLVVDGGWTIRSPLPADHPDLPARTDKTGGSEARDR
jgi:3-oxoacyl-[acyl-carrier protein] reductase